MPGGVRTLTSHDAVLEDVEDGGGDDPAAFWPHLRGPLLLVRATLPLPGP